MFAAFAFKIKVLIIVKMIQWNYQLNEAKLTCLYARNCATIQQILIFKFACGPKSYRVYRGTGPSKTVANTTAKCYLSFCRSYVLGILAAFSFFTFAYIITTWCLFDFVSVFRGQENVKGTPRKHSLAFVNVGVFTNKVMLLWGIVTIDVLDLMWWDRRQNSLKSLDLFIYVQNFWKIYFQYVTEACKYCTWTINKAMINSVSFLVYWVCNWCSNDRNRVILLKPWNSIYNTAP